MSEQNIDNSHDLELNSLSSRSFFISENINTDVTSIEQLREYVKYPMIYNAILRVISQQAYNANGQYANTIDYSVSIPTLDYITTLRNKSETMKKKKKNFNSLFKRLNHKRTTRDILRSLFINGMYVGILRDTQASNKNIAPLSGFVENLDRIEGLSLDDNFMIQPLDLDYCKVIGTQNNVSIVAFDMMYFEQFKHGGLLNEIKNYPKEFMTAYMQFKKDSGKRWHILDYRQTICLKFRASELESYGRPYGLAAFTNIQFADEYATSQYKLINELASSIYYLILPESDKKGACSLNKEQQHNIIQAFENAVKINTSNTRGTKVSTLTLAPGSQIDRLSKDSSLLKDTLSEEIIKKISTDLGFASSALNASSSGASYANLQVNIDLVLAQVFQCLDEISVEYTRVLNELLNIQPKDYIDIKYLRISSLNQDKMYERAKELYLQGMGSLKYWICTAGFDSDDYINMMEEELEDGIFEKFTPHQTSFTYNGENSNNDAGGRPLKDDRDLTVSGQVTRTLGSNKQVKKSTDK